MTDLLESASTPIPPVETILERVDPPLSDTDAEYVRRAYNFARKAHEDHVRASGAPYFTHCVEVATLLAELVTDWPTIAAGLLHDTIEDCDVTREDIRAVVPDPVAELVEGVTKISIIHFATDQEKQAHNLRKMVLAMAQDVRVVLIKLCDRLHNMRTLEYVRPEKQQRIAQMTIDIFAPLAKRLGMERICRELEDLSLKYLQPVIYRRLAEHLERNSERYVETLDKTRELLNTELKSVGVKAEITGRLKHLYSLYNKMRNQGLDLYEVHDLMAVRIIVETVEECYVAFGVVHRLGKPVEGRLKDYIASPKPNGYRSIHTTVLGLGGLPTEIQIRTREMHHQADEGIAAHWNYKEEGGSNRSAESFETERLAWLRQLLDWLTDIRDPEEFMAAIKKDVFEASVFCYTPAGDVHELPRGSTVLDFAYRIHTDVGHRCSGAKIDHKMVPLRTELKTGNIVEIVTSKVAHPNPDWLKIAQSGRARNKIRHWLKTHQSETYLERGKQMFIDNVKGRAPQLTPNEAIKQLDGIAPEFSYHKGEDLLIEIGFGSLKPGSVVARLILPDATPVQEPPKPRKPRPPKPGKPDQLYVEGIPGAITRLAQCCAPEQGDKLKGFVTQGRGISVHRANCKSLKRIELNPDRAGRLVDVEWGNGQEYIRSAKLRIICKDRQSLLLDITQAVSQMAVNIIRAQTDTNVKTHRAELRLTIQVHTKDELTALVRRLIDVPSVYEVKVSEIKK